ncbi:MAG: hypothetical protein RBR69_05990 [Candidatus Cloacimonadaceae bacterium]|nr:hypothetical protein [Candidatus Cloacimonadota bacterium]MDY0127664.1 hypothetical protein [Candidatus Cloacimonadaceae bacterium]MCB5254327.1 hypothetical protein [Candidatus Cloacimonadota bacterium]MCK9178859.1 hypothetical protein [Candidatus Cloacimonadota bacterium]MCK9242968.1 hypothetical protein [Candidatus Cloacimonadota bacterium]
MKKVLFAVILVSLTLMILGCGSNKNKVKPDGDLVYRPAWWSEQNDPDYVCTYGQSANMSENASLTAARSIAMSNAAQYVQTNVESMMKYYLEEAGVVDPGLLSLTSNIIKTSAKTEFSGAIIGKNETRRVDEGNGPRFKTWIQMKIPKEQINKSVWQNVRNEEALYNQFKASQAFQELDEQMKKYE